MAIALDVLDDNKREDFLSEEKILSINWGKKYLKRISYQTSYFKFKFEDDYPILNDISSNLLEFISEII